MPAYALPDIYAPRGVPHCWKRMVQIGIYARNGVGNNAAVHATITMRRKPVGGRSIEKQVGPTVLCTLLPFQ